MKAFARLFESLDETTKTNDKIDALVRFFEASEDKDKLWAVALLGGKRPKRAVQSNLMKDWIAETSGIPMWLFEESYQVVGDLSETIALLLPEKPKNSERSLSIWMQEIIALSSKEEDSKKQYVTEAWKELNRRECFIFNKLIGGSFRVGISQKNMVKALSRFTGKEENDLAHRIMGNWSPETTTFETLILKENRQVDLSKPYPFYLAYALDEKSGFEPDPKQWMVEHKWDGIRGQLIKRSGELFVWSRGEELVTEKYPELFAIRENIPDGVVIDGEILPFKNGKPLSFGELQRRIGRKTVGKKLLEEVPVHLFAYDLMEFESEDIRNWPLAKRRKALEQLVATINHPRIKLSEAISFHSMEDLKKERGLSREKHSEGLMLKRMDATYKVGRKRGDWWKWKVDPLVIDAVLIYAMRGHGRRANLYTDYTFAVWNDGELTPFTKAYSGLTDEEFRQVDRFVKANILEKFGPVRSVKAELVFEIAFEGINNSTRHKSGIALRFPRMNRWRKDKKPEEAGTLEELQQMLTLYG